MSWMDKATTFAGFAANNALAGHDGGTALNINTVRIPYGAQVPKGHK
jgi:hypothetical protein